MSKVKKISKNIVEIDGERFVKEDSKGWLDIPELEKQIKSELKFLNCQVIKHLVKMADFGSCHEPWPTIENRKKKWKFILECLKKWKEKRLAQ